PVGLGAKVAWVQVDSDRRGLALAARNYYGRPDGRMLMIGVTGTNGKTTVCFLLEAILREAGLKPCLLGTVMYRYNRDETKRGRTSVSLPCRRPSAAQGSSFRSRPAPEHRPPGASRSARLSSAGRTR